MFYTFIREIMYNKLYKNSHTYEVEERIGIYNGKCYINNYTILYKYSTFFYSVNFEN